MKLKMNQRQVEIYQFIKTNDSVKVQDLIEKFQVSAPTLRKDLTLLEQESLIVRTHGAARIAAPVNIMDPFETRATLNKEAKERIAEEAVKYIDDGDSIILDSGTTNVEIAKRLVDRENLSVFTNSIPIAMALGNSNVNITLLGGMFFGRNLSVQGPDAEEYLNKINVNKAFISSSGVRPAYGLVNSHPLEANLKKRMIHAAHEVYAVLDSSKIHKSGVYAFAAYTDLDYLITESAIDDPVVCQSLKEAQVEVIIAK